VQVKAQSESEEMVVLDLACGTGNWLPILLQTLKPTLIDAWDSSEEVISVAKAKLAREPYGERVCFTKIDFLSMFPLPQPPHSTKKDNLEELPAPAEVSSTSSERIACGPFEGKYDLCFMGFFLSHIPPALLSSVITFVRGMLKPGGHLLLVDSKGEGVLSPAVVEKGGASTDYIEVRKLSSGQTYRIVKVYYNPSTLAKELVALGWLGDVHATAQRFIMAHFYRPKHT
jgi:SAM-dependent methyltransferase